MIPHEYLEKDPTHINDPEEQLESPEEQDAEILEIALERYSLARDAWSPIFSQAREDAKFAYGDQWDATKRANRVSENRSVLTYNKSISALRYVENNARANPPGIDIHPVSDGADANTAKVLKGVIRSIEYRSSAKSAYIHSLMCALAGGFGFFRVLPKTIHGRTRLSIDIVRDPTTILYDPDAEQPGLVDASYCFVIKRITKRAFERQYPDAETSAIDPKYKDWYESDSVQVAEYWVSETQPDGTPVVAQYLITGDQIIDRNTTYPGKHLPFCFVPGQEVWIDDHREYRSMIHDIVDMQRLLNYAKSEQADTLSGATKAPWLVEASMIANYQAIWNQANYANVPYLPYDAKDGRAPQQVTPQQPPAALITAAAEADADIRSALGIRDPLQDIPASQSGKAIGLQIQQANIGSFGFLDNLNAAIRRCAEILLDLIPYYYSGPQVLEILGQDGQITPVKVNQPFVEKGKQVIHDLTAGEYAVTLSTGPSYESKRTETADKLVDLVAKYPNMMQVAGDLIVRNLDFDGANELADRLRAQIPPQILAASSPSDADSETRAQVLQNQMQMQMQQMQRMQQQIQQMGAALNQAQQQLQDRSVDQHLKKLEIDTKLEIAKMHNANRLDLAEHDRQSDSELLTQRAELQVLTDHAQAGIPQIEQIGTGFAHI